MRSKGCKAIVLGAGMYNCTYVSVPKKFFLNDTLAAILHCETLVEGSLFSFHTNALAVEAIGALCTRQFIRQILLFYYIMRTT